MVLNINICFSLPRRAHHWPETRQKSKVLFGSASSTGATYLLVGYQPMDRRAEDKKRHQNGIKPGYSPRSRTLSGQNEIWRAWWCRGGVLSFRFHQNGLSDFGAVGVDDRLFTWLWSLDTTELLLPYNGTSRDLVLVFYDICTVRDLSVLHVNHFKIEGISYCLSAAVDDYQQSRWDSLYRLFTGTACCVAGGHMHHCQRIQGFPSTIGRAQVAAAADCQLLLRVVILRWL